VSHTSSPPAISSSIDQRRSPRSFRPWWRWLLTALAFPPAGLVAHAIVGPVDSASSAILAGLVAGAGIGTVQWVLLRHRGVGVGWVPATAVGLSAGLAVGASIVSFRTDVTSLAVMGAVSGLGMGGAQGAMLRDAKRMLVWSLATAALWALGWPITVAFGIDVEEQWVNFGASGCLTFAFLQSMIIGAFVPAKALTS
jgi:hypothetical protein